MAHSYGPIYIHLVFGTSGRERHLSDELHSQFGRYLTPIFQKCGARLMVVGGAEDHVHILLDLGRECSLATLVREVKSNTSRWIAKTNGRPFAWQRGYAAISVSPSVVPSVSNYISNQKEHHRKRTFKEEYEAFLRASGTSFDPKYLWEDE